VRVSETQRPGAAPRRFGPWNAPSVGIIRPATPQDEAALVEIESETWLPHVSPAPHRVRAFFEANHPDDVLVAVIDGRVVGYVVVRPATPLSSNAHVLKVAGLGVRSTTVRQGVAGGLLDAAEERAVARHIERLTLHVLAINAPARALYEKHGYRIEGVLRGEFRLPVGPNGTVIPVDDVLMAKTLAAT